MLRRSFLAGAAACGLALAIAYFYMERHLGLAPCPLCILDRIVAAAMGLAFFALYFANGRLWRRTLLVGNIGLAAAGLFFSGRHVWLQRQPLDEAAGCLNNAAADSMLEIIRRAFDAHGDCGAVYWQFAGMSIPEQTLLLFLALAALAAWQAAAGWNQ